MPSFEDLSRAVLNGDDKKAEALTKSLVNEGKAPLEIINNGLIAGMAAVGKLFKTEEMFVPEVLMAARAMNAGMDVVRPMITDKDMPSAGKVVLGTVKGDLHDIGKNLVGMMLESSGFSVVDLGVDISPEQFVAVVREQGAGILALSALLTTTMLHMKDTIDLLKEEGLKDQVKVVIGGAPISQDFADEIGADGFAPDAGSVTELCRQLIGA